MKNKQGPIITFFFFFFGEKAKITIKCKDAGDFELSDYLLLLQSFNEAYEICEAVVFNPNSGLESYKSTLPLKVKHITKQSPLVMELLCYVPDAIKLFGKVAEVVDILIDNDNFRNKIREFKYLKNLTDDDFNLLCNKIQTFTRLAKTGKIIVEAIEVYKDK